MPFKSILAAALAAIALLAVPSFATAQDMVLKPGQTLILMTDGQMVIIPTPLGRISTDMMAGGTAVDQCMLLTMGADGKLTMAADSKLPTGMMACDELQHPQK